MYKQQQHQLNELTSFLVNIDLTPETSDTSIPLQMFSNDGNIYFNPKADLLKYFQETWPDSYISETELMSRTRNGQSIAACIAYCMFQFRSLKASKGVTYGKMCKTKGLQTIKPLFTKLQSNTNGAYKTVIQVFDRRADPTKGATERKRGVDRAGPFQCHEAYRVEFKEKLDNHGETWRDREFGRKKIMNTYARWFETATNIKELNLPPYSRHIIVGGEGDKVVGYEVSGNKQISLLDCENFKSRHPEADTGVFNALYVLLDKYDCPENTSFIIDCPETDCLTICLLEFTKIKGLLDNKNANLYFKMHNRKVDATGKIAKSKAKRKSVDEKSIHSEDFYIDFRKMGELLNNDEILGNLEYPAEAIGVISVITGNDKNPGFRLCTKKHALTTYKEMVKNGKIGDLDDEHGCFPHNIISQTKYKEFVATMYFRLYRVEINGSHFSMKV